MFSFFFYFFRECSAALFIASIPQTTNTMTNKTLDISRFEKRVYTPHATPLEAMPQLSAALGGNVNLFIKRDDMLGLTGGGNKTRKLEYVMADAIKQGADTIITCGAVQSNHCRLTLSACNKEGLSCCLVVEERVAGSYKPEASGNNYLFRLLGAETILQVGLGEAPAAVQNMADELRAMGRNVYCIPGGASNELGATGYVACAQEIQVICCLCFDTHCWCCIMF
jgi:D-cysteine desulfhydrase